MGAFELGQKLVEATNIGREGEQAFVDVYYDEKIVSIEGGSEDAEIPNRLEGIEAVRGKHDWWFSTNDVHGTDAVGPYLGHRDDQFVVHFTLDITPNDGERMQMKEVGLFTVRDDKIVQEEFMYLMG